MEIIKGILILYLFVSGMVFITFYNDKHVAYQNTNTYIGIKEHCVIIVQGIIIGVLWFFIIMKTMFASIKE